MKKASTFHKYLGVSLIYGITGILVFGLFGDVLGYSPMLIAIFYTPISLVTRHYINKKVIYKNGTQV